MNERSFIVSLPMSTNRSSAILDRQQQILEAAMLCFAKRGFHQTSMHDISAEAGISVGLIYRYFKNKEEVIAALADEHKKDIAELIERASEAPTLLEAMEILFTSHCCEQSPQIISAFVVDLFAEASRNPQVAKVVRNVVKAKANGVADLIARSPEARHITPGLNPHEVAEMIFAVNDGTMMRSVLQPSRMSSAEQRDRQLNVARTLWRLLFAEAVAN
ncbi:MAG TPA: TetR/AcrR family transcriptional regulator [Chthoniobacteraceae bacterium]|nr:TetR/AcrR family transcriptional regulator [Chthoniobacteraceae bacterium]